MNARLPHTIEFMSGALQRRPRRFAAIVAVTATIAAVLSFMPITVDRAEAATFNPGRIIDDEVFYNSRTMSVNEIQSFLNSKVPSCQSGYTCLKNYSGPSNSRPKDSYCAAYAGSRNESAALTIYKVSTACGINPQVLLVTLQKEQGLVTHDWPSTFRYTRAMGYACPDTAPCDERYFGFFNQVYNAARQFQIYTKYSGSFRYKPHVNNTVQWHPNSSCGTSTFVIQNQATANLYNYTPYRPNAAALRAGYGLGDDCSSYGNRNFFNYFNAWFGSTWAGLSTDTNMRALQTANYTALGSVTHTPYYYPDGGVGQAFEHGWGYWSKAHGGFYTKKNNRIAYLYIDLNGPNGILGYPITAQKSEPNGGASQRFQNGAIYAPSNGTEFRVAGAVLSKYVALSGPSGSLGYPTSEEVPIRTGVASQQYAGGSIYWTPRGTFYLSKVMNDEYVRQGGANGTLGLPKSDPTKYRDGTTGQQFENGTLFLSAKNGTILTQRHAGPDRYATSVSVSSANARTGGAVYVATGEDFPDALSAAALAGSHDAPVLLVTRTSVPSSVRAELARLKPTEIVIVGSAAVVSTAVESTLKSLAPTTRIAGTDRYETSRMVASALGPNASGTAFVSTGKNFPDALSAGAAAASIGAPVILVDGGRSKADNATIQALKSLKTKNVVITGTNSVVTSGIAASFTASGFSVTRLWGADRYGTAAAVNAKYFPSAKSAYFATGATFADALSGSAAAGSANAPLYITKQSCIPRVMANAVNGQSPSTVHLVGSDAVVGDAVGRLHYCA